MPSSEPPTLAEGIPTQEAIDAARLRLGGITSVTRVRHAASLSALTGAALFLVEEHLQVTGSFKARGASNAIAFLAEQNYKGAVATSSSGNHGAACAFAAQRHGLSCVVVMPKDARGSKINNVKKYGATPMLVPEEERLDRVKEIVQSGAVEVHPYAARPVIAGQATLGLELLEALPELRLVIAPLGGGGLSTGISLALDRRAGIKLMVVEPVLARDAWALAYGRPPDLSRAHESIADALRSPIAPHNLKRLMDYGAIFATSSEEQIAQAWKTLYQHGYAVEPSAALGLAALLAQPDAAHGNVAVVLTGGNANTRPGDQP